MHSCPLRQTFVIPRIFKIDIIVYTIKKVSLKTETTIVMCINRSTHDIVSYTLLFHDYYDIK